MSRRGIARLFICAALAATDVTRADAICDALEKQTPESLEQLHVQLDTEMRQGNSSLQDRIRACGLSMDSLQTAACGKAFTRQDQDYLLANCHYEAWDLARAQCERNLDTISPRYQAFCRAFGRE